MVAREVLAKGRRALIHYGAGHLLHQDGTLASIIEQQTKIRTYAIIDLVPLAGDPGALATKLLRYRPNTVIPTGAGTWLGKADAGDVIALAEGRVGGKPFNPDCGIRLGKLADAGLYLGQPAVLTESWPNPAIYLDPAYWTELQRRSCPARPHRPGQLTTGSSRPLSAGRRTRLRHPTLILGFPLVPWRASPQGGTAMGRHGGSAIEISGGRSPVRSRNEAIFTSRSLIPCRVNSLRGQYRLGVGAG